MKYADLPEPLRNRLEEMLTLPPIDSVTALLSGRVQDTVSLDEVRRSFASGASQSIIIPHQYADLVRILTEPQPPGTLHWLVEGVIGWGIDHDPSDRGAAVVLWEIAGLLREELEKVGRLNDFYWPDIG